MVTPEQDHIYRQNNIKVAVPDSFARENTRWFDAEKVKAYPFTTENLAFYMPMLDLQGKRVAAIAGSGDFPIGAYRFGVSCVDAFDVMPSACLFGELKVAGLRNFDYQEFLRFFATTGERLFGPQSFNYPSYEKIRDQISNTARDFFDSLITPNGRHQYLQPRGFLIAKIHDWGALRAMVPYLKDESAYRETQERLGPILFYPQDIKTFCRKAQTKYDVVYISNILAYGDYNHWFFLLNKGTIDYAKAILRRQGEVIDVSNGYTGYEDYNRQHAESVAQERARDYKMTARSLFIPGGYTVIEHEQEKQIANRVIILAKRPSVLDRLLNQ